MILFENRYASIQKKEDCKILELNWKNFTPSEPLRNILLEFSGFHQQFTSFSWLFDHEKMKIIAPEDQKWLFEDWITLYCTSILNSKGKIAIINSNDLFGKLTVQNIAAHLKRKCHKLQVEIFTDIIAAQEWLNCNK